MVNRARDLSGWLLDALPWPLRRLYLAAQCRSWPPDSARLSGFRRPPERVFEAFRRLHGLEPEPAPQATPADSVVNYAGPDESVECGYPPCTNRLRRSDFAGPQWCSKGHREATEQSVGTVYEFRVSQSMSQDGWYIVKQRVASGSGSWQVVASAFGERRAEVVRAALDTEPAPQATPRKEVCDG